MATLLPRCFMAALLGLVAGMPSLADEDAALKAPAHRESASTAAIERFWTIYHRNDYAAIGSVEAQLQAALRQDPNNPTLHALLGAAHFWHFGEYPRDLTATSQSLQADIAAAVQIFNEALDLDYYGEHLPGYVNDDHLPGYLGVTLVHLGQLSGDAKVVARGDRVLDLAVYQFPEFNSFNRWAAHNTESKDSVTYRRALESLWQGLDACVGGHIDRANPDIGPYLTLQTAVGRKKTCWSEGDLAPHSFEGFMMNLGNGLVKAGQIDAARIVYANAKYADHYASWPYRQVLESIASSDLTARAALYADNDPKNDPPMGVPGRGCVYCHATAPETAPPSR